MNGNDDTHQRTEGTQGYGPWTMQAAGVACQGAYSGPAPCCDVRAAAGAQGAAAKKAKDQRQAAFVTYGRKRIRRRVRTHACRTPNSPDEAKERFRCVELSVMCCASCAREITTRFVRSAKKAGVSLGYLSEVERGQKEASSELLWSIAAVLGAVHLAQMLRMVADYLDSVAA